MSDVRHVLSWPFRLVGFGWHFVWKLTVACADVAWDVISPNSRFAPGIIEFPLRCRGDVEITMMANLITLTPGTLTLAVRRDPPTLWVHGMYSRDRRAAFEDLRDYEARMLSAIRPDGRVEEAGNPSDEVSPKAGDQS